MTEQILHNKERLFDLWAPFYDFPLTSVFYQAVHKRLIEYLELTQNPQVLDLGCGTGLLLNRLATTFPQLKGVGLDLSEQMITEATEGNLYPHRLSYQQGNAQTMPFHSGQFTMVFNTISFLHYPHPHQVLQEIYRVLSFGGYYYLADFTVRDDALFPPIWTSFNQINFYSPQQRQKLATAAGLTCLGHYYLLGPVLLTIFVKEDRR